MSDNNKSPHILNTSSNLLGLCFLVLTYIRVQKLQSITIIDDVITIAIVFFMASSILSFLSLRSNTKKSESFENIADYTFLIGLFLLFGITMLVAFNISK